MGDETLISWADRTFNPWEGCQKVGPGCDHCYAEARNHRFAGGENWGPGAPRRRTSAANWRKPLAWERESAMRYRFDGTRDFVFCASLADVFDNAVDPAWREDLFETIRRTPHLVWLLLTKRPGNIAGMIPADLPRNVALGCTIVNQVEADRDIPKLLQAAERARPAFTFLSMEPLLERVVLPPEALAAGLIDWVIVGGESGPNARPMETSWAQSLRAQCRNAPTTFLFKQAGGRDADKGGHLLDGELHLDRPRPRHEPEVPA